MSLILRSFVSLVVFAAVYFFSLWMLFAQIIPEQVYWLSTVAALLTAMVSARLVWISLNNSAHGILATAATGAAIVGAIGFCGGFFGPMILAPGANQGPLLGLFITGPLGLAAGAIGGLIYGLWRRSHARTV